MTTQKNSIINEIKEITAQEVAKKQDAAKLNFPKLIEKIKFAAKRGESKTTIPQSEMNEYDRTLLQNEGFRVWLIDEPKSPYHDYKLDYTKETRKVWEISW